MLKFVVLRLYCLQNAHVYLLQAVSIVLTKLFFPVTVDSSHAWAIFVIFGNRPAQLNIVSIYLRKNKCQAVVNVSR